MAAIKKKKSVGAIWPAEPPKRPSLPAPGLGRFYLAIRTCVSIEMAIHVGSCF